MGRKREGTVVERVTKKGIIYALRFVAYRQRRCITLDPEVKDWTREDAETELTNIMADVRRGIWVPPAPKKLEPEDDGADDEPKAVQTFREFALKILARREHEVDERTYEHDEWALRLHLLPYFGEWLLSDFDTEGVDDYRGFKVAQSAERQQAIDDNKPLRDENGRVQQPLANSTINRTINVLSAYLAIACDYKHIPANPAEGKRRKLKVRRKRPVHLDTAEQVLAVLDAAVTLDDSPRWQISDRHAIVATLLLAGPRTDELARLLWRDIDLANRRIYVGRAKTDAGLREIPMRPLLHAILTAHKAKSEHTCPDDLVFPTNKGKRRDNANIRNRILAPCLKLADELLLERGHVPLPQGVTPHKLRHTFASVLVACGEDPASVMAQLGHTDSRFTLNVYTHLMSRDPAERRKLKLLVYSNADPDQAPDTEAATGTRDLELVAA